MRLSTIFARAFWLSLVPMFFVARYGENHWGFDSIGNWYIVYCAVSFALLFAAVVVGGVALTRILYRGESKALGKGKATDA